MRRLKYLTMSLLFLFFAVGLGVACVFMFKAIPNVSSADYTPKDSLMICGCIFGAIFILLALVGFAYFLYRFLGGDD